MLWNLFSLILEHFPLQAVLSFKNINIHFLEFEKKCFLLNFWKPFLMKNILLCQVTQEAYQLCWGQTVYLNKARFTEWTVKSL